MNSSQRIDSALCPPAAKCSQKMLVAIVSAVDPTVGPRLSARSINTTVGGVVGSMTASHLPANPSLFL
jgi:hypothetical protein